MKTRHYFVSSAFCDLLLNIGKEITVHKRGHCYSVNRKEAANILKTGRKKKIIDKIHQKDKIAP